MPRRRAVRLLGGSMVAALVPAAAPRLALGAPATRRAGECGRGVLGCPTIVQGASGPDKCCGSPYRFVCGGTPAAPTCDPRCPAPSTLCPTGKKDKDDVAIENCCVAPRSIGCCKGECIPNCKLLFGEGHTPCCASCCPPGQTCKNGECVAPCPAGRVRCGRVCCKKGETCKKGKCCPTGQGCGSSCCGRGSKCAFATLAGASQRVCCPENRLVSSKIQGKATRFCCPETGGPASMRTVAVEGGTACCPPNRPDCCDETLLTGSRKPRGRVFCVNGRMRRL
jgi:hypothetical protein